MSQVPTIIPRPPAPGQPLSASQFGDPVVAALASLQKRLEAVEKLVGGLAAGGTPVLRLAGFVVSVTTGSPSTYGNTKYTVRAVGTQSESDLVDVKPVNRIVDDDDMPVVPRAEGDPCVIVRSFDSSGDPVSWLEMWELHPSAPCEP